MAFTFIPDLDVEEVWEWSTDVITARQGDEVRLSLAERATVSQGIGFDALTGPERRDLWRLLADVLDGPTTVPLFGWAARVTGAASSGATTVPVATPTAALGVGDRIVFLEPTTEEVFSGEIASVTDTEVGLTAGIPQAVGPTWVAYKGMQALVQQNNQLAWNIVSGNASVDMGSWISPVVQRVGASASLTSFNSIPVLEAKILSGIEENIEWPLDVTDFGLGRVNVFSQRRSARVNSRRLRFSVERLVPSQVDYWRLFLDTVRGSWKVFLLDTQLEDLELAAPLVQGATTLTLTYDAGPLFLDHPSFQNFKIEYSDGTSSMHTVSASGTDGTVAFSPALPSDPKVANVSRISYLLKARMSDRLAWRHNTRRSELRFDITTTDNG